MIRRCMNCMREFSVPPGYETVGLCCPHCGYLEGSPPKELNHLFPGTILKNRYQIGVAVGYGGFGVTYKAWDTQLEIVVAIKEYFPTGQATRAPMEKNVIVYEGKHREEYYSGLDRFLEEARRTARYEQSKYIVRVMNFFKENNTAYLVMEFLGGESLKDYLKEKPKLPLSEAMAITDGVMEALKTLHQDGILHRDIGPGNIFIQGNSIKVIDFGAARLSEKDQELTRSVVLTPGYAPPEQYQTKSKQGPWTDIYAVAATLYHMLTGVKPDESTDRLQEDTMEDVCRLEPSVPVELSNAIMKGMAVNANLRFRTDEEFLEALHGKKKVQSPKDEVKRRRRNRGILIAAISVVLLCGLFFVGKFLFEDYYRVHLADAAVSIWVPYNSGRYNEAEAKAHYDGILSAFHEENPNIELTVSYYPEEELRGKLLEASKNGTLPDVFMTQYLDDELLQETAVNLKELYEDPSMQEETECYFLSDYQNSGDLRALPTGINVPVCYCIGSEDAGDSENTVKSLEEVRTETEDSFYLSGDEYELYLNSFGGSYRYLAGRHILDETAKKTLGEIADHSYRISSVNPGATGQNVNAAFQLMAQYDGQAAEDLFSRNLQIYLGGILDLPLFDLSSDEFMGYDVRGLGTDQVCVELCDYWCISKTGAGDKKVYNAARKLLIMLLFEESQNAMNTGYSDALPMNRKAYDIYVETAQNGLGFLKTYPEKWRLLLGEDQVKEKAGSAELQHSVVMEGTMTLDEWLDQE